MAELKGKGLTKEVTVNKRNLAEISEAVIKQDLDYILHVQHELPMEWYTKLEAVKQDIIDNLIIHADAAIRRSVYDLGSNIASRLKEEVGGMVLEMLPETREKVTVTESHDLSDLMKEDE